MIWVGSAVAESGEKLSDEIFQILAETGRGMGWEAMRDAVFYVHEHEWRSIAYLLSVAYGIEERGQGEWEYSVSDARKWGVLWRFLVDVTEVARQVRNDYEVQQLLERYFIMPMGLFLMPQRRWKPFEGHMPVVIRWV